MFIFNSEHTTGLRRLFHKNNWPTFFYSFVYILFLFALCHPGQKKWIGIGSLVLLVCFIWFARYRKLFALIFVSGFIFFCVGELQFRINTFGLKGIRAYQKYMPAALADPNAFLQYDDNMHSGIKSNFSGFLKGQAFHANNLGFRDKSRTFYKPEGVYRIVVLGASRIMGAGVPQEHIFTYQLEQMLNSGGSAKQYEVLNLAIANYGMDDMIHVLKEIGLKFQPDLILMDGSGWKKRGLHSIQWQKGKQESYLLYGLSHPSSTFFFYNAVKNEFIAHWKAQWRKLRRLNEAPEVEVEDLHYAFSELKSVAGKTPLGIISFRPMRYLAKPLEVNPLIPALCQQYNIFHINTFHENYGTKTTARIIYSGDRHPNASTHRIYAKAVHHYLVQANLL